MQYFHISNKRGLLPFSFCLFQTSEPTWSSWASPLPYLFIFEFLHCISFPSPPPTLGGGTYAIIGRRSHLKFCYCNLHTWILLHVKTQVRRSEHAQATMLEERNTDINDVDRICIKGKLQWVDTLENWQSCTERQTIYKLHTIDSSNEIMYLLEYLLFSLWGYGTYTPLPLSSSSFRLYYACFWGRRLVRRQKTP